MGQNSANPPAPPGMTAEEKNLLEKQGLTIDKFNEILSQGSLDAQETQNLLRNISGLYKEVRTPGSTIPGQSTYQDVVDKNKITNALNIAKNRDARFRMNPIVIGDRGYTQTQLEQALNDVNVAKQLGLTTIEKVTSPDQVIPESVKYQLDPTAVEALKARVAVETKAQQEITDLANQRQIKALKGEGPVSVGLMDRKAQEFRLLREAAARKGIVIEGDDPATAVSQSSAGNELVGQFKRTYGLLEDAERSAAIYNPMSTTSSVSNTLGLATQSPTMAILPQYGNLSQSYSGLLQPYTNQRMLGYQSALYGYGQGQQNKSATSGLLGMGAMIAARSGNPWGYGIAAGLGGLGLMNSF